MDSIERDPRCSIAISTGGADIGVEGDAERVTANFIGPQREGMVRPRVAG
jgi:hypothetical protein